MQTVTLSKKKKKHISVYDYTHAVCMVSVSPIRKIASDSSEMVSQLLFGEMVEIITRKNKSWMKIECSWDGYVGWVDPKQFQLLEADEFHTLRLKSSYAFEIAQPVMTGDLSFPVLACSSLINYDGISAHLKKEKYVYNGHVIDPETVEVTPELITKVAKKYLNAPYLWGGRSPFGIDCSGFTQNVFKFFGIRLPRDAYQQGEYGEIVDFVENSNVGDLAFFENKEGKIHHVGIILEDNKIIHASGMVRIDNIDHFGIYHQGKRSYTHQLRYIRRML